MKRVATTLAAALFITPAALAQQPTTLPATQATTQAAQSAQAGDEFVQQASTFVKAMRFADADKTERVTKLTADYLRQLRWLLDQRQAALEKLGQGGETPEINLQTGDAYRVTRNSTVALRDAYVAQLDALMTPYQVDRIKDGITGDAFSETLESFCEMIPDLTFAQRAHIAGLLVEMRENAMMELGAVPQEQWVHKYRGIINNYVSRLGHDFTSLSKAYEEKRDAKKKPAK